MQQIVDEIVREYENKIFELKRLTADLPRRLRVSDNANTIVDVDRWSFARSSEPREDRKREHHPSSAPHTIIVEIDTVDQKQPPPNNSRLLDAMCEAEERTVQHGEDIRESISVYPSEVNKADQHSRASSPSDQQSRASGVTVSTMATIKKQRKSFSSMLRTGAAAATPWISVLSPILMPENRSSSVWDMPKVTQTPEYELFMGIVIILNILYMGVELQYAGENHGKEFDPMQLGAITFLTIYALDLLARLRVEMCGFFSGKEVSWNIMDGIVVLTGLAEQFLRLFDADATMSSLMVLRTLRLLRLLRILHIGRLLKNFKEFKLLMYSLQRASGALLWTVVLCMLNVYIFAIAVAQGSLEYCQGSKGRRLSCMTFGKLSDATLNMYKAMMGGVLWGELFDQLHDFGAGYQAFFLFYIVFSITIIMNLATGVVLDIVQDTVRGERDVVIDNYLHDKIAYVENMQKLFAELDVDSSGGISYEELTYATKDVRFCAWLESMGIDMTDVDDLFHLLDRNRTGVLDIEEFVLGCMRLKGGARTVDVMKLQLRSEWLMKNMESIQQRLDGLIEGDSFARSISTPSHHSRKVTDQRTVKIMEKGKSRHSLGNKSASSGLFKAKSSVSIVPRQVLQEEHFENWKQIDAAELRAMTIKDLKTTWRFAKEQCASQSWMSPPSDQGQALQPHRVNLYHFDYHCISPRTAPKGISLHGLKQGSFHEGQRIVQQSIESNSTMILAAGLVIEVSADGVVFVKVLQGRFREMSEHSVMIDDVDVGFPSNVSTPMSISWKELAFPVPLKPKWFCSHWWGEPVQDFVSCCDTHSRMRGLPEAGYWVCAYANRQNDLAGDISNDPDESSFRRAMRVAEGTLLLLDDEATPFRRIWCDFELYQTLTDEKSLDIVTVKSEEGNNEPQVLTQGLINGETVYNKLDREQKFPLAILAMGLSTRLEDGDASVESDKVAILRCMAKDKVTGKPGDETALFMALSRANTKLHSYLAMAAWPQALKKGRVERFDPAGSLGLPRVLARDEHMEKMEMNFAYIDEMTDAAMQCVANGIPKNIIELHMSFEGCSNISDGGMNAMSLHLPSTIEVLFLSFVSCDKITDHGLKTLAAHLPPHVRELRLDFAHCGNLGMAGVKYLADGLPGSIKRFAATFQGTEVDRKFSSVKELQKFARKGRASSSSLNTRQFAKVLSGATSSRGTAQVSGGSI